MRKDARYVFAAGVTEPRATASWFSLLGLVEGWLTSKGKRTGIADATQIARPYFDWDQILRKIVVGWVGRKLGL